VRTVSRFSIFLGGYSTRALEKGFRKMSYECQSSVERTYQYLLPTLAPNGALPAVILLQPVQALKAHSLAPKNFHTIRRCHKKPFCLKRPIRFAPKTQDPWSVLPEMVAFKHPLTVHTGYPSSLGSSVVIEIETPARRKGLERIRWKRDDKSGRFTSSLSSATLKQLLH